MNKERWRQIEAVFNEVLARPENEQKAYLAQACGEDAQLRAEIESLLAEKDRDENLLSDPALSFGLTLLAQNRSSLNKGQKVGAYEIIEMIGSGGMGEVYLAEDPRLARFVAVKILPALTAGESDFFLKRFRQEAFAASAVSHPNVAHIYETGFENERPYIVMEYVEGQTLRRLLKDNGIDLLAAVDMALQTARALAAAHEAGIIHRDIKPENVIVRDDGYVKVLDFGLAKIFAVENRELHRRLATDSSFETSPGLIMGTTNYMSPEQASGNKIDQRTDLWSLGAMLYEMLAGRQPFTGETPAEIGVAIRRDEPEKLPPLEAEPELLETIIGRALAKELPERYQSAREMTRDLQRAKRKIEAKLLASTNAAVPVFGKPYFTSHEPDRNAARNPSVPASEKLKQLDGEKPESPAGKSAIGRLLEFIKNLVRF